MTPTTRIRQYSERNASVLELACDAFTVMAGIYFTGTTVVAITSGEIAHWGSFDYASVCLIAVNVALSITCAVFANRILDREGE